MNISPAVFSGLCASFASLFGKLSGLEFEFLSVGLRYVVKGLLFSVMVMLNSLVWSYFVQALHTSKTAVEATAVSTATNYALSGILGLIFFNEVTGILWWCGISLVVLGIIVVCHSTVKKAEQMRNLESPPREVYRKSRKRGNRKSALRDR